MRVLPAGILRLVFETVTVFLFAAAAVCQQTRIHARLQDKRHGTVSLGPGCGPLETTGGSAGPGGGGGGGGPGVGLGGGGPGGGGRGGGPGGGAGLPVPIMIVPCMPRCRWSPILQKNA